MLKRTGMGEIASTGGSRAPLWRWAAVTVPLIVLLGFLAGRSVTTGDDSLWYRALAKPELTPPGWVFPIAWATLYILMGLALAMILNARGARGRGLAITLFAAQFALCLAWTPVFFGAHRVDIALAVIAAMLVLSISATILFARIRIASAWLMVPYLIWISFAGVLTWRIGQLNPDAEALAPPASAAQMNA